MLFGLLKTREEKERIRRDRLLRVLIQGILREVPGPMDTLEIHRSVRCRVLDYTVQDVCDALHILVNLGRVEVDCVGKFFSCKV